MDLPAELRFSSRDLSPGNARAIFHIAQGTRHTTDISKLQYAFVHRGAPSRVLGGSRLEVSLMDSLKCQTVTATPAEPGDLPCWFS
jgi:hypothetical protein